MTSFPLGQESDDSSTDIFTSTSSRLSSRSAGGTGIASTSSTLSPTRPSTSSAEETSTTTPVAAAAAAPAQGNGPTADERLKYGLLFPYAIKDVKLSDKEDQPTVKGKQNIDTALIGIGDVSTLNIDAKHLRNWGIREKMGIRQGTKAECCVAVVNFVRQHR